MRYTRGAKSVIRSSKRESTVEVNPLKTKICCVCKEDKDIDEFHISIALAGCRSSTCKICHLRLVRRNRQRKQKLDPNAWNEVLKGI